MRNKIYACKPGYGWIPDVPDVRDLSYALSLGSCVGLPSSVDLRPGCPPVYNQGSLGSCTAQAIGAAYQFCHTKQFKYGWLPSRLFIYFNERVLEGTVNVDSGASLRDGIKTVVKQGVCREAIWGYDISKFSVRPPVKCYSEAMKDQVKTYLRLNTLGEMRECLASGLPFVFGFSVYESFERATTATTGKVTMPKSGERLLGGHAVMAVGYDDTKKVFIVRNSWSEKWGDKGYCYMPYDYLQNRNLSDDFWTIRMVE